MPTLVIKEITFSAAHYLPKHPKCGGIHGHTYYVRNLIITTNGFVDFKDIREMIDIWDHTFIIPRNHSNYWSEKLGDYMTALGILDNLRTTKGPPIVENIAKEVQQGLLDLDGVESVSFELSEGPNQGVRI